MKWKREYISEKKMEVFEYVVRKSAAKKKKISYGPEGGVKSVSVQNSSCRLF